MYVMEIHDWISSIIDTLRNQGLFICHPNFFLIHFKSLTSFLIPVVFLCSVHLTPLICSPTLFLLVSQAFGRMSWSLDLLPLPPCVELGGPPLSGLLWTLLLLFLWYCYRVGADPPSCSAGSHHSVISRSSSCSPVEPGHSTPKPSPVIAVENDEEDETKSYLMPVLSHALFPAQAAPGSRKLYTALQEYAKRYSWVGMGRIHKGLRIQVRHI